MSGRVERGTFRRWCRRCGWEGTYSTAGMADNRKHRHPCDSRVAKAARSAAYAARIAAIDRTPKPCLHKRADHQHGTNAAYVLDKCRCYPCSEARVAQDRGRNRQKAYGRYDRYVGADQARDHLRNLLAAGMGPKRIAAVSGMAHGVISAILYGKYAGKGQPRREPNRRVLRTTHDRIMAIEPDLADRALVDATGTTRRIRALVALGWSQSKLADRLAITRSNFTLARGERLVRTATARDVAALYDELSMTLPPETEWRDRIAASRARHYATERGWLPPLALDDEHIDDPYMYGHLSIGELFGEGLTVAQVAGVLGSTTEAVDEYASRRRYVTQEAS